MMKMNGRDDLTPRCVENLIFVPNISRPSIASEAQFAPVNWRRLSVYTGMWIFHRVGSLKCQPSCHCRFRTKSWQLAVLGHFSLVPPGLNNVDDIDGIREFPFCDQYHV
jgi:hypothetical protein